MIDERVRLIAVTNVPTHGGLVNPAADIGRVPASSGSPTCWTPASRWARCHRRCRDRLRPALRHRPQVPAWTARHGFPLCSRSMLDRLEPPFLDLHAARGRVPTPTRSAPMPAASRTGRPTTRGRSASASPPTRAVDLGLDAIEQRVTELAQSLRRRLRTLPGVLVHDKVGAAAASSPSPSRAMTHTASPTNSRPSGSTSLSPSPTTPDGTSNRAGWTRSSGHPFTTTTPTTS